MNVGAFLINELMESSSSSDDDAELVLQLMYPSSQHQRAKNSFVETIHNYSNTDFKENLRISRETVTHIIERFSQSFLKRNYKGGRIQTNAETQLLIFLWFCGNKTTFREVSNLFEVSISNVHSSFNRVLNFFVNDVAPEVIQFPRSDEEKETVANEFKKIDGIPNILGCIGGSYIDARTPKHNNRSTFENRLDRVSITLQAICDSKLKFLDIFTGIPSKISDSEVLKMSSIGKELHSLCSDKYYLLGDAAYPIRKYLLTPYKDDGNLDDSEKNFNTHFFRTRIKIESAFCLLKNRFQQLMRVDFHNVETMAKFITACCVLHNICLDRNDIFPEEISNTELNFNIQESMEEDKSDILLTQFGEIKRDQVKNFLLN